MIKYLYIIFIIPLFTIGQVGIGTTTPDPSSILDIENNSKGLLISRLTEAQRDLIPSPATGLLIYQTNNSPGFYYFNGITWQSLSSQSWGLTGNAGTNPTINKIGTLDAQNLIISTNNTEASRITSTGNIGVNTTIPTSNFHVRHITSNYDLLDKDFEDNTLTPLTTNGDASWFLQTSQVYSGTLSAVSGNITDNQESILEFTATIPAEGARIEFYVRIDAEDFDEIEFDIDGTTKESWFGFNDWEYFSVDVEPGFHTFTWTYIKDFSDSLGADEAYLDNIRLTINANTSIRIQDGNQSNGRVLVSDGNGVATWQDPTALSGSDNDWTFFSGSTNSDPIYHTGGVVIGSGTSTTNELSVWNGSPSGTRIGLGSVEFIRDGINETQFNHSVQPLNDNQRRIGGNAFRFSAVYATNGVINTSDKRLKTNIKPLKYGLKEILKLRPITFKWKDEFEDDFEIPDHEKEVKLGFIAQELQAIIPEVVKDFEWAENEEEFKDSINGKIATEYLGVSYSEVIAITIKAIQEQQIEIDNIKSKNKILRSKIELLNKAK